MRTIITALMGLIPFLGLFAQQSHEAGVILLQVRQPQVVRFSGGQALNGSPQLQSVLQQYGATDSRKLSHVNAETDGCYRIEFPVSVPLAAIRDALSACPEIKVATLNYYGVFAETPNDTYWSDQWALQKIGMPDAWDIIKPNSAILVGILDSGLDYTHEDLVDNIWTNPNETPGNEEDDDGNDLVDDMLGWDFEDDDNDPQEVGTTHGTRTAGMIEANSCLPASIFTKSSLAKLSKKEKW